MLKKGYMMKRYGLLLAALFSLLSLLLLNSCGDTTPNGEVKDTHVIRFVHALLAEDGHVHSYLEITRNGEPFNLAAIGLYNDSDTLPMGLMARDSEQGTYSGSFNDFDLDTTRLIRTELNTPTDQFTFSHQLNMPDTFSFAAPGQPGNLVRSSDGTVPLEWTASRKAHGYFVIVEPASSSNQAAGYAALVNSQVNSVSVPMTAFQDNLGFRVGEYNVWVVAYQDNPIDSPALPFTLPAGFTADINRVGVTGQAGAIYVPEKLVLTAVVTQ
ncbi:MAG: hypothetical protein ABIJ61_09375 [bacterium]